MAGFRDRGVSIRVTNAGKKKLPGAASLYVVYKMKIQVHVYKLDL